MTFLTVLGVTEICSFRLVLEDETDKEIPESSRLDFLEQFLANNLDNTTRLLNSAGVVDLPLLKTVLAIHQKSAEPSLWEVIDSFVLLECATLAASRTLLQQLLACLNFPLDSEDFFFWYKRKKLFLWTMTAHKQLKTMEMSEV